MSDGGEVSEIDFTRSPEEDPDDLVIEAARTALGETHVLDVLASHERRADAVDDLRAVILDGAGTEVYKVVRRRIVQGEAETDEVRNAVQKAE